MKKTSTVVALLVLCLGLLLETVVAQTDFTNHEVRTNSMKDELLIGAIKAELAKQELSQWTNATRSAGTTSGGSDWVPPQKDVRLIRTRETGPHKLAVLCLVAISTNRYLPQRFKVQVRDDGRREIEADSLYPSDLHPTTEDLRTMSVGQLRQVARRRLEEKIKHWTELRGEALEIAASKHKQLVDDLATACVFAERQGVLLVDGMGNRDRWVAVRETLASKSPEEVRTFLINAGKEELARMGDDH